jgi:SAM-dependent methyltransferase
VRFEDVEEAFHEALSESLEPRGFDLLFDLVAAMGLPPGSDAVDIGCRVDGPHARELASRFGFNVVGIDPDAEPPYIVGRVEELPLADQSMDLVWCRDVLMLVEDLPRAFSEMHRVLRPGGRALVYIMVATDTLDAELAGFCEGTLDPEAYESAMQGFRIDERVEIGSEWGELDDGRKPAQRLLWAARLKRDPERYVAQFGRANYDVMLADCLWHVYAMLGKLHRRAYLLTKD